MEEARKELLEYISKLNDRHLRAQRASGVTMGALVGLIVYLTRTVFYDLFEFFKHPDLLIYFLPIFALILNLGYVLLLLAYAVFTFMARGFQQQQVLPIHKKASQQIIRVYILVSLFIYGVVNIYAGIYSFKYNTSFVLSMIIGLFIIINSPISALVSKIKEVILIKTRTIFEQGLPELQVVYSRNTLVMGLAAVTISLIIAVLTIINSKGLRLPLEFSQIKLLINVAFIFLSINFVIGLLLHKMSGVITHGGLQELERVIITDDLSVDEISSRLEKEIMGYSIMKWIKELNDLASSIFDESNKIIDKYNHNIDEILLSSQDKETKSKEAKKAVWKLIREVKSRDKKVFKIILKLWSLYNQGWITENEDKALMSLWESIKSKTYASSNRIGELSEKVKTSI